MKLCSQFFGQIIFISSNKLIANLCLFHLKNTTSIMGIRINYDFLILKWIVNLPCPYFGLKLGVWRMEFEFGIISIPY